MGGEVALAVAKEPSIIARAIRAAADVIEVEEVNGFCASVLLVPGAVAVARLDRSLVGALHEGAVLRWTMLHTTGVFGHGFFIYHLGANGPPPGSTPS